MKLICLSLLAAMAFGQVSAQFKPEPHAVLSALHLRTLSTWNVMLCNDGAPVTLAPERIKMAAPAVPWIETDRIQAMLTAAQGKTFPAVAATVIEIGLDAAGVLGGFGNIAMSKRVLGYLAAGTGLSHYAEGKLQGAVPSLAPYTSSLLQAPISLSTGACATYTLFAGKMKAPATVIASIPPVH